MPRNFIRPDLEKDLDEEKIIFKMHRHPFGLITLYLYTLVGLGASFGLIIWSSTQLFELTSEQKSIAIIAMFIIAAVVILLLFIATNIYWASRITLTDDEVRQTIQQGLFSKKKSRLGLANVEDVTVSQDGFFSTIFKFGTINIETAGEQANFMFKYCPDPEACAKLVMETREKYLEENPEVNKNEALG